MSNGVFFFGQHLLSPVSQRSWRLAFLWNLVNTKLTQVKSESHSFALSRLIVRYSVNPPAAYVEATDFALQTFFPHRSLLLTPDTFHVSHCPAMASCLLLLLPPAAAAPFAFQLLLSTRASVFRAFPWKRIILQVSVSGSK